MAQNRSGETAGDLFATVSESPAAQDILRRLEKGRALSGVAEPAHPFLAALLHFACPNRPIVLVADGLKTQERLFQDVQTWLESGRPSIMTGKSKTPSPGPEGRALFFPDWEILPEDPGLPHSDVIADRLRTLTHLAKLSQSPSGSSPIVVTNAVALMQKTLAPAELARRSRHLHQGIELDPLDLIEWLEEQGYEPEAQVTQRGEIALRGGIVDLFPPTSAWPVRLEFLGSELESLREFDPLTQLSRLPIDGLSVPPAGELAFLRRALQAGNSASPAVESVAGTLADYFPPETMLLLSQPDALAERAAEYSLPAIHPLYLNWEEFLELAEKRNAAVVELLDAPPPELSAPEPEEEAPSPQETGISGGDQAESDQLRFQTLEMFRPIGNRAPDLQVAEAQRREFFSQLHRWMRQGYSVHVFCNNQGEKDRFIEIWRESGLDSNLLLQNENGKDKARGAQRLHLRLGTLSRGFLFEAGKLVIVTDAEVFGRYRVQRPRRLKSPQAQTSRSLLEIDFADLKEGDFVVHLQHGIGRYLGLKMLPVAQGQKGRASRGPDSEPPRESNQECLVIEFAPGDADREPPRLYVPVTEAYLVSKYVGAGKARPALNTLGGSRWAKTRAQAERAVRDLAADLLALQAARESKPGHAFPPDTRWQQEFESSFLYEETPDQMRAIVETKKDMESDTPMDRLICGDVGYGKTEVALRAAFKAVMGGKQVAVLVPTTVLAQQHFNTFRERMSDYPVRIDLLSRFRNRREQKKVITDLASGAADIVIGTHRLVQGDIHFKDLGLVVVDEEQRFGVRHKETLKQLRQLVDVLTLSATPIPRTLYLALTGARHMSTIETPPQDRLPVETIVTQFDERIIRDAIRREINRQGQVFFLHNRVSTIEAMALRLRTLVPEARMVVGHGQMDADELEEVMTRFVNGEADVLLSTTIIESGLDIPNANTILIDRADRFGLSELYQLRGRVGRYKHQAYAYLLLPRHAGLLADARKRIGALKQYSSLGSGFKIAMRDLEIRGAGNLLGPEQSGHITAVGFELYCQLLKQSVSALRGEPVKPRIDVAVDLDFLAMNPMEESSGPSGADSDWTVSGDGAQTAGSGKQGKSPEPRRALSSSAPAYIPTGYISLPQQRIEIYRKVAQLTDKNAVDALRAELRDRFGPMPASVDLLLQVAGLKIIAGEKGVGSIETREGKLMLSRNNDYIMLEGRFPRLTKAKASEQLKEIRRFLLAV